MLYLPKAGLICGIVSPILWLTLIGLTGAMHPDFSHLTHFISELGARGSRTEGLMRYAGFEFTGLLYLVFAFTLLRFYAKGWLISLAIILIALDGIGRIGAGIFPCDPGCIGDSISQHLHRLFASVGFGSGILSSLTWGIVFQRLDQSYILSWYSVASGLLALTGLLLFSWPDNPIKMPGLFEHLASALLSIWLLVLASYFWCQKIEPR
jgi:hypothetical membrane protein